MDLLPDCGCLRGDCVQCGDGGLVRKKEPLKVLTIVYEDGTFVATCHSCFLECKSRGKTIGTSMRHFPCHVGLREHATKEGDEVRGRG